MSTSLASSQRDDAPQPSRHPPTPPGRLLGQPGDFGKPTDQAVYDEFWSSAGSPGSAHGDVPFGAPSGFMMRCVTNRQTAHGFASLGTAGGQRTGSAAEGAGAWRVTRPRTGSRTRLGCTG